MTLTQSRLKIIKVLVIAGILISILASLESHVSWLAELCGIMGNGCRDTSQFTIFNIQIAIWGIAFFILMLGVSFISENVFFYLLMAGAGVELNLIKIMVDRHFICFFCILNLIVVLSLLVAAFERKQIWKSISVCLLIFILSGSFLLKKSQVDQMPKQFSRSSGVIAVVNGKNILEASVDKLIAGRLYKYEWRIYESRRDKLNLLIKKEILKLEAEKKGLTPEALENKILSVAKPVSETEIEDYYEKNKGYYKTRREPKSVLERKIGDYLQEKKTSAIMDKYLVPMMRKYNVKNFLTKPSYPSANTDISENYFEGPDDAKVVVVEFSDYMCPSCRRAHKVVREIRKKFKGKIKWVFKDFPLKMHTGSKELATAARCAGEQGKFWEYQDLLFTTKGVLDNNKLFDYAEQLGLDKEKFKKSFYSYKYMDLVENDIKDGKKVGVSSTPTFIIDGKLRPGCPSLRKFEEMLNNSLANN